MSDRTTKERVSLKVLVCGGRDYQDRKRVYAELDVLKPTHIIEGGATGADALACGYCEDRPGTIWTQFKANWKKFGHAAGPLRNTQMLVDGKPDLVLAFPGGRGTANMIAQARASGVPVKEIA